MDDWLNKLQTVAQDFGHVFQQPAQPAPQPQQQFQPQSTYQQAMQATPYQVKSQDFAQNAGDTVKNVLGSLGIGLNSFLDHQWTPGGSSINNAIGDVMQHPDNYNLYSQMAKGNLNTGLGWMNRAEQPIGQFANNYFAQPAIRATQDLSQAVNPANGEGGWQRAGQAAMGGLNALAVTPGGAMFNTAIGAPTNAALNALFSIRKGQNPIAGAEQGALGNQTPGLGTALTDNKTLATIGNIAQIPAMLAMSNPRGTVSLMKNLSQAVQDMRAGSMNPALALAENESGGINPDANVSMPTLADIQNQGGRPASQSIIEDLINKGDLKGAQKLVDTLPQDDPYAASMQNVLKIAKATGEQPVADSTDEFAQTVLNKPDNPLNALANEKGTLDPNAPIEPPMTPKNTLETPDNFIPAKTPPVEDSSIPLQQAANNGLYAWKAAKQDINQMGNVAAQYTQDALKTPEDQEALRQVLEHPDRLGDYLDTVSNPEKFMNAVQHTQTFFDRVHDEFNQMATPEQKLGFLKDYYSHIIDTSTPEKEAALNDYLMSQMKNYDGWFNKTRIFKDIDEMRAHGLDLKNQTVAQDIQDYAAGTAKQSAANAFINEVSKTHPNDVFVTKPGDNVLPPANFVQLRAPGMMGTYVSPELAPMVENTLGKGSALAGTPVIKAADKVNQLVKEVQLGMGGFHAFKTTIRQAVNDPTIIPQAIHNAFSPEGRLAFRNAALEDGTIQFGSKIGVTFGESGDMLQEGASTSEKLGNLNPIEKFNQGLFGGLIDTYKMNLVRGAMDKFDLSDPADLEEARKYGAQINNIFGGINYDVLNRNKTVQQILRLGILAPDFNEGKLRQIGTVLNPTTWGTPSGQLALRNTIGEAVLLAGLSEVGRKLTTGSFDQNFKDFVAHSILSPGIPLPNSPTFNSPDKTLVNADGTTRTVKGKTQVADLPGSNIADIARGIQDPVHFLEARGAALPALAVKMVSGKDYYGQPLVDPYSGKEDNVVNRGTALAQNELPIPGVQAAKTIQGKETPADAALNTFGFRIKNNPTDPATVSANTYFASRDAAVKGLDPNQVAEFNSLHPQTRDSSGNPVTDKTAYTKPQYYTTLLDSMNSKSPDVYNAEVKFQQSQPGHAPYWDWSKDQQRAYFQSQLINEVDPSGDKSTVTALKSALPADHANQMTNWYNSLNLPQSSQSNSNFVQTPPEVQQFWDQYKNLPMGTGARSQALKSSIGQQALALLDQQKQLTNAQRADMGLPMLADSGSSGGSYSGSSSYERSLKRRLLRIQPTKVKSPHFSVKFASNKPTPALKPKGKGFSNVTHLKGGSSKMFTIKA